MQGLSLIFINSHADTVVVELLQDIPPHWQVTYAGEGLCARLGATAHGRERAVPPC